MNIVDLDKARDLLLSGEVVAIPTETVYGLGGWINSDEGLRKIFSTKERPFFDPLIVHIDGIESAKKLSSDWTQIHDVLAKACWPGPLTLIAKKNDSVSPLITSGLDSVGLRCPRHEKTLELLKSIPGGVAAPSANKFGKTSPTQSQHVYQEFGDAVAIIEGGASDIGIESTVAGVVNGRVEIFRPGFYTAQKLKEILKEAGLNVEVVYAESPVAPGQLKHHYMPKIPLVITGPEFSWAKNQTEIEKELHKTFKKPAIWLLPENPSIASRELYQKMREFDEQGFDIILTPFLPNHSGEEWLGIWNRLEKAKTLSLARK
ncbi:L-threonylcarbamoyladenylate synthase [Peredibacter sp. HCB2-198]|uniref:L-threonylcarbamoyladenylate synthase n=1 Tax=Peredibacter sp. HCB2-198 TaxID=3383025 RepID=UPI0038B60F24